MSVAAASSLSVGEAIGIIVNALRDNPRAAAEYGYDVYLTRVWSDYVHRRDGIPRSDPWRATALGQKVSGVFFAAAWELCRRGILRPGVREAGHQVTDDGQGGCGYSLTPMGLEWLQECSGVEFISTEPSAIGRLFRSFAARFGDAFHQRAQEAVRCYGAHANLAACAMAGAAAESILLAAAIAKIGDEDQVLRTYQTAQGRNRVMDLVVGQARAALSTSFRTAAGLLAYWRDNAAHGRASTISEMEAHDALARLLRLAQFVSDNWEELTGGGGPGVRLRKADGV